MRPANAFILMIGDDGAMLAAADVHAVLFTKSHDAAAMQPIIDALQTQPQRPVIILADVLAQEFRREELPKLGLVDRKKLRLRRLQQHFPQALLKTALPLRHHAALLAALHEGGAVSAWLERLAALPNPSGGVCLLPLESAGLLHRLLPQASETWGLLLSWHRTGGFRQIVTHRGELVFTRLTPPLPFDSSSMDIAESLARDLQATRIYLARLGLDEQAALHAVMILPEETHEDLTALDLPVQSLLTLTPHQAALQLSLPLTPAPDDAAADMLHAGWLMGKLRPRALLMRDATRRTTQSAALRQWGQRTAFAAWLLALVALGWQGQDLLRLGLANSRLATDNAALERQLAQARATLVPATEPLGRLRQAVERRRLYTMPVTTPWPLLDKLGGTLAPAFRLTKMDWHDAPEKLDISLHLKDENQNPQSAQRFDQLAAMMRKQLSGYDVAVAHYPFPIKPDEILSNDHAADQDAVISIRKVTP